MNKILACCLLVVVAVFNNACGPNGRHEKLSDNATYSKLRNKNLAQRLLPDDYTGCNLSLHWSHEKFDVPIGLDVFFKEHLFYSYSTIKAPATWGWSLRREGYQLDEADSKICKAIRDQFTDHGSDRVRYELKQYFSQEPSHQEKGAKENRPNLASSHAELGVFYYQIDPSTGKKVNLRDGPVIPLEIACKGVWNIKTTSNPQTITTIHEPVAGCTFDADDLDLDILGHKDIKVAISGIYEPHPKYPVQKIIFNLKSFGFKR
jgi:hypothetical protein